jgi:hypothetical protein
MTTSPSKITDYADGFIKTYDDLLSEDEHQKLLTEVFNLQYHYGETDEENTPPSGMTCDLDPANHYTHNILESYLKEFDFLKDCYCQRSYVNTFAPNERTYFHHDFTQYTALYYPGPFWNINDEGETKFFFTSNPFDSIIQKDSEDMPIMVSIAPIPNRLVIFKGDVLHSATSFRDKHRFSVAFKFLRKEE